MKTPQYTITNLILNYIVKYELSVSDILHYPLPDKYKSAIQEKYQAEDIEKMGELVGNPIGYNRALQIQRGQEPPSQKKSLRVFTNLRNVQDYIASYSITNALKPSIELSTHINKLLMKNIADDWDLAKLRGFSEKPNEIYDTWYKYRDFYPNLDSDDYFNDLFDWIKNGKDHNHFLIKLGILLYEFIDKAPFLSGNQMSSVLTLEILSKIYGYNPDNIFPYFKALEYLKEDLGSAFKLSKSKHDMTMFLEAFLYTLSYTAIEISREYKDTHIRKVKNQGAAEILLNPRQIKLLDYLAVNFKITRSKYTKIMGISFMTSYRDLQDMMDKGYIKTKGKGRGTYYIPAKEPSKEDVFIEEIA